MKSPRQRLLSIRRAAEVAGVSYQTMANLARGGMIATEQYEGPNGRTLLLVTREAAIAEAKRRKRVLAAQRRH